MCEENDATAINDSSVSFTAGTTLLSEASRTARPGGETRAFAASAGCNVWEKSCLTMGGRSPGDGCWSRWVARNKSSLERLAHFNP